MTKKKRKKKIFFTIWLFNLTSENSTISCFKKYIFNRRYATESQVGGPSVLESVKEYLLMTIQRTFEVSLEQAECLYEDLIQCTLNKHLVSISDSYR